MTGIWPIAALQRSDKPWVMRIWKQAKHILGPNGDVVWYRYWDDTGRKRWHGWNEQGFVLWNEKRDGTKVILAIAVDPRWRRTGLGQKLVEHVGLPCELVTDAGDPVSNAFYVRLGFARVGQKQGGDGTLKHIYRREA